MVAYSTIPNQSQKRYHWQARLHSIQSQDGQHYLNLSFMEISRSRSFILRFFPGKGTLSSPLDLIVFNLPGLLSKALRFGLFRSLRDGDFLTSLRSTSVSM